MIAMQPVPCPLCHTDDFDPFLTGPDRLFGVPGLFSIVKCRQCGHKYTNPQPTTESVMSCYPPDYAPHGAPTAEEAPSTTATEPTVPVPQPWYLSRPVRAFPGLRRFFRWLTRTEAEIVPTVAKLPDGSTPPRGLEVGCGDGKFLARLAAAGWEVEAVEPSPAAAARAQARGFRVQIGMLDQAHLPDDTYDAVFMWMVLEHVANPRQTLLHLYQALKPGGTLAFSIPNAECWESRLFGKYWVDYDLPRHLQHFSVERIRLLLQECGFEATSVVHQRSVMNLIGSAGVCLSQWFPRRSWGLRLLQSFRGQTPLWLVLPLSVVMKVLVPVCGSGRLTITAGKPLAPPVATPR